MLAKKYKFNKKTFKIIKDPKKIFSKNFYLKIFKIGLKYSLFSVIIPSSTIKKAVERNILKRRIMSVLEKIISQIKPGLGILIYVKSNQLLKYKEIDEEIKEIFKKAQII